MSDKPNIDDLTTIAFVIDDEVVEIMYVQEKFGAILLSDPKLIHLDGSLKNIEVGYRYTADGSFLDLDGNKVATSETGA